MKTLVVYFSRKGYVKKIAEEIAAQRDAQITELKSTERTKGFLGFWWCGRFGMHRWGMPIEPLQENLSSYDKVIFCSPIWVFTVSAPVWQFICQSSGQVRSAEYVLVHFCPAMRYPRTVAKMDAKLGLVHESYTSIACPWGRRLGTCVETMPKTSKDYSIKT